MRQLIILLPVVTVFVIATELFNVHGLLAALLGVLTIPITTYFVFRREEAKDHNNESTATSIAIKTEESSPANQADNNRLDNTVTFLWLGTIVIVGLLIYLNAPDSETKPTNQARSDSVVRQITHPAYLVETTKPTVDFNDEIKTTLPLSVPVWVEDTRLDPDGLLFLRLSYQVFIDGQVVYKINDVVFPGVTFLASTELEPCLMKKITSTLNQKYVTIDMSGYAPVILIDGVDVAESLVREGYGNPTFDFPFSRFDTGINYAYDGPILTNMQRPLSEIDPRYYRHFASHMRDDLIALHQLAKIKKIGVYGSCNIITPS